MSYCIRGISVVVPVYNSESVLKSLLDRLHPVLESTGRLYEVILVNDGSSDKSWPMIQAECASEDWIRGINLMRNYGQHSALLCGIRAARYDITVTMDDDLQNPPEEIPRLLMALGNYCDVVYGVTHEPHHGTLRKLASISVKFFIKKALGAAIPYKASSFRVFRTQLRETFKDYSGPDVSIDVLLTWGARNLSSLSVRQDRRLAGRSNYTFAALVGHALNMITGFSSLPLRLASLLGFAFMLFGIAVLIYVLGRYFIQGAIVPGFAFIASIISIFAGVQLFSLGIIGEYIARIHFRTMDRPPYSIREESSPRSKPCLSSMDGSHGDS
ncbi:MAG: glycosyltransferase family 2 protein [Desulfomonilaceae bacterium]